MKLTLRIGLGILTGFLLTSLCVNAQQTWLPREPSPAASVSQTVGISIISINYSRPSVRGRVIWGTLVSYGLDNLNGSNTAPWRAGANENTVIHLSDPAKIEGILVPPGDYGLFFTINKDNTGEVILSRDYKSWGSFFYNPKNDQMRAKIMIRDVPDFVERLNYSFDSVSKDMAELDLNWEKKQFPVKIEFAVDEIVMNNSIELLKGQTGFIYQNLNAAAAYAIDNNLDTVQAMRWVNKSIGAKPDEFESYRIKSDLLKKEGDQEAANKYLKKGMQVAKLGDLNAYGYELLAKKNYPEAIDALKTATEKHPDDANAWDSLGEAYALSGDKKNAIINFKKSLSMNPPGPTKANSEKYLKQLGAM